MGRKRKLDLTKLKPLEYKSALDVGFNIETVNKNGYTFENIDIGFDIERIAFTDKELTKLDDKEVEHTKEKVETKQEDKVEPTERLKSISKDKKSNSNEEVTHAKKEFNFTKSLLNTVNENKAKKLEQERLEIMQKNSNYPYLAVNIMTDAERQLFHFMKNNLYLVQKVEIFTKVRLADIINVDKRMTNNKDFLYKITNKHLDYVICDAETLEIICAVELQDYTHDTEERKERDKFVYFALQSAGIKLINLNFKIANLRKEHLEPIEELICIKYAIPCPVCGSEMKPYKSRSKINYGHRFYGCLKCPKTIDID